MRSLGIDHYRRSVIATCLPASPAPKGEPALACAIVETGYRQGGIDTRFAHRSQWRRWSASRPALDAGSLASGNVMTTNRFRIKCGMRSVFCLLLWLFEKGVPSAPATHMMAQPTCDRALQLIRHRSPRNEACDAVSLAGVHHKRAQPFCGSGPSQMPVDVLRDLSGHPQLVGDGKPRSV